MTTKFIFAGHGKRPNGTFDSGATGLISKGEHRFFEEDFFPLMKQYANDECVFFTDYNVFAHGNIVDLAKQYGNDTEVYEFHFDASGNPDASGGHVIVASRFAPDAIDLRLRDGIKKHVGVRYNHRNHEGISGRSDLGNVNRTANGGVNYRLLELFFGTSPKDVEYVRNNMEDYAKDIMGSILGKEVEKQRNTPSQPQQRNNGFDAQDIAKQVNRGIDHNGNRIPNGWENRRQHFNLTQSKINQVSDIVNGRTTQKTSNSFNAQDIANQVIRGKDTQGRNIPNGWENRKKHFNLTENQIQQVRTLVNNEMG